MKSLRNSQLYQLSLAHFREIIREPEVLFWGMIFPVLISIGLGIAFTQPSEAKFRIAITDSCPAELDTLLARYAVVETKNGASARVWTIDDRTLGRTQFRFVKTGWHQAVVSMKRGESDIIVADSAGRVHYHFDPHNSQSQLAYLKLSSLVRAPDTASDSSDRLTPMTLKGVRYIDFLIPGLLAFGMMSSILWGVSYTIIEKRSQKLLRRMIATPMRKSVFLISLMLVRTVMNFIEAAILFFFAWLIFGITVQGNVGALMALFMAGCVGFSGIAVLVSCHTAKTEVGTGWINAVQMPMMIFSGVFFSYHNFPEWSLGAIRLLPLTALADGIRSIFNEGAGWTEIATPSIALFGLGAICFTIGMKSFKWF
ncbi:MAG: ABC transporter permease [Bacteroidales bacterium]|jgi:ABC-type multidrug transport system permease subunit|nr:ABC transporter permease [Bacteroidales bacterium]